MVITEEKEAINLRGGCREGLEGLKVGEEEVKCFKYILIKSRFSKETNCTWRSECQALQLQMDMSHLACAEYRASSVSPFNLCNSSLPHFFPLA